MANEGIVFPGELSFSFLLHENIMMIEICIGTFSQQSRKQRLFVVGMFIFNFCNAFEVHFDELHRRGDKKG